MLLIVASSELILFRFQSRIFACPFVDENSEKIAFLTIGEFLQAFWGVSILKTLENFSFEILTIIHI